MARGEKRPEPEADGARNVAAKARQRNDSRVSNLERRLREALAQQAATAEILHAISTSPAELQAVFAAIARNAVRLCGTRFCAVFQFDGDDVHFVAHDNLPPAGVREMQRRFPMHPMPESPAGRAILTKSVVHLPDATLYSDYAHRFAEIIGWREVLAVPMLHQGVSVGAIVVAWAETDCMQRRHAELLQVFAHQAVIAIENVRLFREIELKSRQLELASQHKSEFLTNMSHELRTPLNAIIGFSEVLSERMFGEINQKQAEYIGDILESGRHLLSLINDILDLSKIEAGRMELELSDFDLAGSIENTLTLVRERAVRRGIMLGRTVDERIGMIRADERKVKQVLLNLLSNALKFTPEGGKIDVRAVVNDGVAEISVTDTGVGIAPGEQEVVFEEFRQVGTSSKKVEGTGLGLAISRKFIELHGGKIWVTSQIGSGSTFAFTVPLR